MKKFIAIILAVITVFSMTICVAAYGEKTNINADDYTKNYTPTKWAQEASDAAELTWYENSKRDVEKGEFMFAFLRMIQASRIRRELEPLSSNAPLDFYDEDELSEEAYEEARILVELGVLSGYKGYMSLENPIKRSEAAKVMAYFNSEMELPAHCGAPNFVDIAGHWAEANIIYCYRIGLVNGKGSNSKGMIFDPDAKLTVEELQQILYNITIASDDFAIEDMTLAMVETFKVTTDLEVITSNITNSVIYLNVGDKLTYTAKDNKGYWTTSDASVAKVTSSGTVTAKSVGEAIVTNGDIAFIVNVGNDSVYVSIGDTVDLSSTSSSKWTSSNKKVATVNKNGEVTGVAEGTTTISRGTDEVYNVTVVSSSSVIELSIGKTKSLGSSRYGKWTSENSDVATVSSSGTVKAVKPGFTIVKNKVASHLVVVAPNSSIELNIGDSLLFDIETDDEWETSKSKVATVSEEGVIKAISEGTATITNGDFTLEVNVSESFSDKFTLAVGDTMIIGNGKYDSSWESSNTRVATVNNYGKVTAKKLGRVTISNDDFDYTVNVVNFDEEYEHTLAIGESITLGDGEYDSSWKSDDESVATVTKYGKVKAKGEGTAIISNDYDEYVIIVEDDENDDEEFEYSIKVGETITIGSGKYDSSWESEDESIATVTRYGKVTGTSAGTVIIYNDSNEYTITVKKAVVDDSNNGNTDTDAYTNTRVYAEGYEPSTYYNAWVGDTIKVIVESADGELKNISLSNAKCEVAKDISSLGNSKYTFTITAKTAGSCIITLDFADGEFEYTINSYKD